MNSAQKIAIIVVSAVLLGVLTAGYLGFVPGVSDVMGTNKPIDLGVKYSSSDLDSVGQKIADINLESEVAELHLTSSELTAMVASMSEGSEQFPLEQVQVKLSETGVKLSGTLNMEKFRKLAEEGEISPSLKSQIETAANIVKTNPSVFLDADIIAFNGDAQIVINTAKIGQISIPQDQLEENVDSINENLKEVLDSLEIQIESISTMNDIVDIQFCLNQTR